LAEKRGVAL